MAGLIQNLINVLENELNIYNELLKLSLEKTPVIVKGDVQKLKVITSKENELIGINKHIERDRIEIMDDIAMVLNKDKDTLTLTALIKLLDTQEEEQYKLKTISAELKKTVNNLKTVNDQNGMLINQALEYVDYNINAVQSLQSLPPVSYQNDGIEKQFEGRNFFDRKQ